MTALQTFDDLRHVVYINLDHRTDRRAHVEKELALLGLFEFTRFPAIKHKIGAIGCSMSHLECLRMAKRHEWPHVVIVEDDILFIDKPKVWDHLTQFFSSRNDDANKGAPGWDVVLLGGNNLAHVQPQTIHSVKITHCQTTTGYIVRRHYYDTLIKNIALGIQKYLHHPRSAHLYSIDKFWMRLQQRHNWFLLLPLMVTQYDNFSDIEQRFVHYSNVMLNLNK